MRLTRAEKAERRTPAALDEALTLASPAGDREAIERLAAHRTKLHLAREASKRRQAREVAREAKAAAPQAGLKSAAWEGPTGIEIWGSTYPAYLDSPAWTRLY
jgi:hypothetical protein